MALFTRLLHRKNLRDACNERDEETEEGPRAAFGARGRQTPARSLGHSTVLEALSDDKSELARFLFVRRDDRDDREGNGDDRSSWFSNFHCLSIWGGNSSDDEEMPSMGISIPWFYALALEPIEVRNERIIMLFEAYTIFGTLFVNVVWIVYEWGLGYGGKDNNPVVERIFGCITAVALGGNISLAVCAAWFWINSICLNSSNRDFVFECRSLLCYLNGILNLTAQLVLAGLLLGIYLNLSPYWPDTISALSIVMILVCVGSTIQGQALVACAPLEHYHMPRWLRRMFLQYSDEKVKPRAKLRAQELRKRAYHERKKMDPNFQPRSNNISSVGNLLRTAAINLGRTDDDVSNCEARLEKDWFNEADQLKNMSVEFLSRYMPWRLAQEVHRLLETEHSD